METTNDRFWRRLITNGPNREDVIDSLKFGHIIDLLEVNFLRKFYGQPLYSAKILGAGRVYDADNHLWRIEFKAGSDTFSAFYSTKTREGFVCDTAKISVFRGIGPVYEPVTDHQLKCLIHLARIADNEKFAKHVLARIVRAIKGIEQLPGHDTEMTENQPEEMVKKINNVKTFFKRSYVQAQKLNMHNIIVQLRIYMG